MEYNFRIYFSPKKIFNICLLGVIAFKIIQYTRRYHRPPATDLAKDSYKISLSVSSTIFSLINVTGASVENNRLLNERIPPTLPKRSRIGHSRLCRVTSDRLLLRCELPATAHCTVNNVVFYLPFMFQQLICCLIKFQLYPL